MFKGNTMNRLQPPLSDIIGNSSPVQKPIKLILDIFSNHPMPDNQSMTSQTAAEQIALHLLGTMNSIGLVNALGYHSTAVTLLRSIEDALDCLFAVVQSDTNANKWLNGELKASEAAREWTTNRIINQSLPLGDYRKNIRQGFNNFSHCSPFQTNWNIYRESDIDGTCMLILNYQHAVIKTNGVFIDRYLCIHLYEFMEYLPIYYSGYFEKNKKTKTIFNNLKNEVEAIINEFLNEIGSEKLYMDNPPELKGLTPLKLSQ